MNQDSPEMCQLKIELWALGRSFDTRELSEGIFEKSIVVLHQLWERFRVEQQKEAV